MVTQGLLDFWTLGPLGLPLPGPVLASQWCDGIEPFGHLWGFFPDSTRAFLLHGNLICFFHSCPFQGEELDKEHPNGEVPGGRLWPFSVSRSLSPSQAQGLQVVLQMAQQQTPSWADLTHSVCVYVWQPRQGAGKLFSLGSASVVSPKAVGWTAVLFLGPWCHEVKFGWRTDVLSRKESWSLSQRMFSCFLGQQMKLLSSVLFM